MLFSKISLGLAIVKCKGKKQRSKDPWRPDTLSFFPFFFPSDLPMCLKHSQILIKRLGFQETHKALGMVYALSWCELFY